MPPRSRALIRTGLALGVPQGFYCRIEQHNVALRVNTAEIVVNAQTRDEVKIEVFNVMDEDCQIEEGAPIAQMFLLVDSFEIE